MREGKQHNDVRNGRPLASDGHDSAAASRPESQLSAQPDADEWFETALGSAFQQLDALSDESKEVPSLDSLRSLVDEHRANSKRKLWKGLAMLWGGGIACSGLMMAAWLYDTRWLIAGQAGIFVSALLFAAFITLKREGGRWTN